MSADSYELIDSFPISDEAHNVKKLELAKDTQQLFFQVKEPYPSMRLIDIYRNVLNEGGWTSCSDSNNEWSSYEDRTSDEHLLVHKVVDHWINKRDGKLLILSAIYYSHDLSKTQPDNDEQRIIVWVQRAADLDIELSKLGIRCS